MIAAALGSVADEVCSDHFDGLTQEPQITSRIGQALETSLDGKPIENYTVRVITQDFPDRGRASLESKSGADLYVGIEVTSGDRTTSKGFLVQAKLAGERPSRLEEQCRKMLARSEASYVWVYGPNGVRAVPARRVLREPPLQVFRGSPLNILFGQVLECSAGDPEIGVPSLPSARKALAGMLEELSVGEGILVRVGDRHQG